MEELQLDRKDLKIQALLEKVSRLAAEKENEIADLRVELTIVSQQLEQAARAQDENVQEEETDSD